MRNNDKSGLSVADLENVLSVLKKNTKIKQVILFGSRAKGNFRQGSDVDIALKGEGLKLKDILEASIEIDELLLPYKFDLIIFDRIKEISLIEHIERVGKTLFLAESENIN